MDFAKLKKARGAIRRIFTKTKNEIDSAMNRSKEDIDDIQITALMEVLENHHQSLVQQDTSIYQCLLDSDVDDDAMDKEMNSQQEYSMAYQMTKKTVEQILIKPSDDKQSVSSQSHRSNQVGQSLNLPNSTYKLPLLKFKEFGGELKDWLPFWSQFSKIDSDCNIDPNDKIQYLVMATLPNTVAREVVESYPMTGDMYPEVIKALKSRFGRDDLLTEFYIRELLKIIIYHASSTKKLSVSELYDKLQCHLRNLETLGVSSDTCAPILLPLVSSCLPEDILKMWERSSSKISTRPNFVKNTSKELLENLLEFLKGEIEGEQKVKLAMSGFGLTSPICKEKSKPTKCSTPTSVNKSSDISTAAGLYTSGKSEKPIGLGCIFCSLPHKAQDCIKAQSMPLSERKLIVNSKRACFCCLKPGHTASKCRNRPKCIICKRSHFVIMCESVDQNHSESTDKSNSSRKELSNSDKVNVQPKRDEALANLNSCNVLMQTLRVNVTGPNGVCTVRALVDSASQRSYVLCNLAAKIGYVPKYQENIQHSLFGGSSTDVICHNVYELHISSLDESYRCHFEVLDQAKICGNISSVTQGPWIEELADQNITFSDLDSDGPIEILIGADVAGNLWTGGHKPLTCKLVAVETKLGWTLMGKIPKSKQVNENSTLLVTSMLTTAKVSDLWTLDSLGILDPYEKCSKQELESDTQNHFSETVKITEEGRFEVCLPWIENHSPLPDNYGLASKRLSSTVKKLKREELYDTYQEVFDGWLEENVIEEVPDSEINQPAHYLPHHPVLKPGSTTPVRPVFDASAHECKGPSLNQCLEKGPNLIEKIPSVMARFRLKAIGVIGDIRKAFLQIVLNHRDRDFLRFLWTTKEEELKVYRHCRVVFGVSSSPFLLEASIKLHIEETLSQCRLGQINWPIDLVETLASSFYVDNCVCSLEDTGKAEQFIEVASKIMNERKFELRGWELTVGVNKNSFSLPKSNVLGLLWDRVSDTLEVNLPSLQGINTEKLTKRIILSTAHRIFDPIGFTCCVTLKPKLLLQHTWKNGNSWDEEVDSQTKEEFSEWLKEVHFLSQIKIPRWLPGTNTITNWTLHMFSDASQTSYASVAFLRVELEETARVQLVAAKSRVAPTSKASKTMTIPRLELLAASISARLHSTIVADYGMSSVKTYFWTDATTVLAWIKRDDSWNVFVNNRVTEIRRLTTKHEWRYVPGNKNPADLPSRGCSAKKLLETRWWEGPSWLMLPPEDWPQQNAQYDEDYINSERKKTVISALSNVSNFGWFHELGSTYKKTVKTIGWIYRFKFNASTKNSKKRNSDLTIEEYISAENKLLSLVQNETFTGLTDHKLNTFLPEEDNNGLIRVRTKVSNREDTNDFCYPIVLPSSKHPIVFKLIIDTHRDNCHVGSQMILSLLRQRFWILGGRRSIKSALGSCVICKRHTAKKVESLPTPLPLDRVRSAKVFEITGVDLAGPLYLKYEKRTCKAWICIFTCSVYRAVHLELLSSLSTDNFLMGLRRFISRRGRPCTIYCDNGTNFTGANNVLKNLNWTSIEQYNTVRKIQWKHSPPTGPWWGGWWERLIGILKKLLRKVLGNAYVNQEEMQTILCDCEAVINSRPLTYVSEDPTDLTPLTPSLFLQDVEEVGVPDLDRVEASDLNQRLKYRQKLKQILTDRFRTEYLGQLQLHSNKNKPYELTVGEVVLIGSDGLKRLNWPLARIIKLIKGKDGNVRLVRLRTQNGELLRPVQRIFPMEIKSNPQEGKMFEDHLRQVTNENCDKRFLKNSIEDSNTTAVEPTPLSKSTRRGRVICVPKRYQD